MLSTLKNSIKAAINSFFRKLKNGKLIIDELSFFLIILALLATIFLSIINHRQFVILAWLPILIAYFRTFSKNQAQRAKENQRFTKYYYPVNSYAKNTYRRLLVKKAHTYFRCKSCKGELRIPKKTNHVQITCPKCQHSFIKKTPLGYIKQLKQKFTA